MLCRMAFIFATLSLPFFMRDEWQSELNNDGNYNKHCLSFACASSITPTSGGNQLPLAAEGFCAICQNNDDMGNLCAIGGCAHRFHRHCFNEYLMFAQIRRTGSGSGFGAAAQCPLCRITVNQQTLNESNIAASQMVVTSIFLIWFIFARKISFFMFNVFK